MREVRVAAKATDTPEADVAERPLTGHGPRRARLFLRRGIWSAFVEGHYNVGTNRPLNTHH
jgi:hypothetical protein